MVAGLVFKVSQMVVVPDGRVGMVYNVFSNSVVVQLGAAGPYKTYAKVSLRFASNADLKAAGLEGVGHKPNPIQIQDNGGH